jgi:rSAM/selenodomain-associated transferase 1
MRAQVLVLAKAPLPGRVKTRLCPPCTSQQAADIARAALLDTLDAVDSVPEASVRRRCLVLDGATSTVDDRDWPQAGWAVHPQCSGSLGHRIAQAFADTAIDGVPSLLIGMDTPQVDGALLARCAADLKTADAVLGHAADGGWWLLGLRDPNHASLLRSVPTSRPDTGERTHDALARAGLAVVDAPLLSDVDTADDARHVAELCRPEAHFVAAVNRNLPALTGRRPSQHVGASR